MKFFSLGKVAQGVKVGTTTKMTHYVRDASDEPRVKAWVKAWVM
ncbi:hypothetical protein AAG747_28210 [Rapidithrix thailandica]|uniref:Uncharacterized protein n=1 Tax=Rapidithrix thailandica TaxID=413964 RepID=A0AAW9SH79_9BACT